MLLFRRSVARDSFQEAIIHLSGALKKAVDLTPFSQVPNWTDSSDEWQEGAAAPHSNDDIIYGGLGSDFLHGGSGDDAIPGAEALEQFFYSPFNPGDVLGYNPESGEFASYDENAPRTRIENFFLNFDEQEGVLESAVIGVPHPDFGEGVVGVLVAKPGVTLDTEAISAAIHSKIARFKQPKQLFVLPELPRNTMGKVQKNVLRDQYTDVF